MYFSCDVCGYKSNYKYNLKRHIKLKHSNCITHISQNGILDNSNDILLLNKPLEKLELNTRNDILFVDSEKSIPKQCLKCFKFFASVKTLNYHSKNCEGIITNPLKCEYCKRSFNNRQNKYKHVKVCKVKDALMILQEHNINNTDNANNTNINNIQHNNQQNIIINNIKNYGYKERYDSDLSDDEKYTTIERNDFGKERIDYITDDEMKKLCKGVNVKDLIDKIHFNDEHPENQNIRRCTNKSLKVLKNNKWRIQPKQTVYDTIEDISRGHLFNYSLHNLLNRELNDEETDNLLYKQELYDKKNKKRGVLLYIDVKLEELLKKRNKEFILENDKKQNLLDNNAQPHLI